MHAITLSNLRNAHGGESMAHMRYSIWGSKAEQDGFPNIARLFRAISRAETVHATNHFVEMRAEAGGAVANSAAVFGIGATVDNLKGAIEGETYEIMEMYPTYLETAKFQRETGAQTSFHWALESEKAHAELFTKARQAVASSGRDMKLGPVQICVVCGWTSEGTIPDRCPICGAARDRFQTFA